MSASTVTASPTTWAGTATLRHCAPSLWRYRGSQADEQRKIRPRRPAIASRNSRKSRFDIGGKPENTTTLPLKSFNAGTSRFDSSSW